LTAPALSQPSRRLRDTLETWCALGVTAALRVLDPPGGAVYLTDGRISYAECPAACGVERLLTASGRLAAEDWRAALAAGRAERRVGEELVQQGLLTAIELEMAVLSGLYGAALLLFDRDTAVRLEMGAGHAIGTVVSVDLRTAFAEVDRRRRALAEACADASTDNHAVVPARRLPGHQVALNALQWEIVANADRRRTPLDLARSLGRDTFATLLEARRLTRAGLVTPGRPGSGPAAGAHVNAGHAELRIVARQAPSGPPPAPVPEPAPDDAPLPRREAQPDAPVNGPAAEACPESTLIRIRDALAALR
jgi:hypothetical protein